jgi:RimJ/RimL family protein N-acetyltransferase
MDQDVGPAETLAVFDHYMKGLLMADPRNYYAQETLKDGTPVTIRAIRKDDKERILDAFRALDR